MDRKPFQYHVKYKLKHKYRYASRYMTYDYNLEQFEVFMDDSSLQPVLVLPLRELTSFKKVDSGRTKFYLFRQKKNKTKISKYKFKVTTRKEFEKVITQLESILSESLHFYYLKYNESLEVGGKESETGESDSDSDSSSSSEEEDSDSDEDTKKKKRKKKKKKKKKEKSLKDKLYFVDEKGKLKKVKKLRFLLDLIRDNPFLREKYLRFVDKLQIMKGEICFFHRTIKTRFQTERSKLKNEDSSDESDEEDKKKKRKKKDSDSSDSSGEEKDKDEEYLQNLSYSLILSTPFGKNDLLKLLIKFEIETIQQELKYVHNLHFSLPFQPTYLPPEILLNEARKTEGEKDSSTPTKITRRKRKMTDLLFNLKFLKFIAKNAKSGDIEKSSDIRFEEFNILPNLFTRYGKSLTYPLTKEVTLTSPPPIGKGLKGWRRYMKQRREMKKRKKKKEKKTPSMKRKKKEENRLKMVYFVSYKAKKKCFELDCRSVQLAKFFKEILQHTNSTHCYLDSEIREQIISEYFVYFTEALVVPDMISREVLDYSFDQFLVVYFLKFYCSTCSSSSTTSSEEEGEGEGEGDEKKGMTREDILKLLSGGNDKTKAKEICHFYFKSKTFHEDEVALRFKEEEERDNRKRKKKMKNVSFERPSRLQLFIKFYFEQMLTRYFINHLEKEYGLVISPASSLKKKKRKRKKKKKKKKGKKKKKKKKKKRSSDDSDDSDSDSDSSSGGSEEEEKEEMEEEEEDESEKEDDDDDEEEEEEENEGEEEEEEEEEDKEDKKDDDDDDDDEKKKKKKKSRIGLPLNIKIPKNQMQMSPHKKSSAGGYSNPRSPGTMGPGTSAMGTDPSLLILISGLRLVGKSFLLYKLKTNDLTSTEHISYWKNLNNKSEYFYFSPSRLTSPKKNKKKKKNKNKMMVVDASQSERKKIHCLELVGVGSKEELVKYIDRRKMISKTLFKKSMKIFPQHYYDQIKGFIFLLDMNVNYRCKAKKDSTIEETIMKLRKKLFQYQVAKIFGKRKKKKMKFLLICFNKLDLYLRRRRKTKARKTKNKKTGNDDDQDSEEDDDTEETETETETETENDESSEEDDVILEDDDDNVDETEEDKLKRYKKELKEEFFKSVKIREENLKNIFEKVRIRFISVKENINLKEQINWVLKELMDE